MDNNVLVNNFRQYQTHSNIPFVNNHLVNNNIFAMNQLNQQQQYYRQLQNNQMNQINQNQNMYQMKHPSQINPMMNPMMNQNQMMNQNPMINPMMNQNPMINPMMNQNQMINPMMNQNQMMNPMMNQMMNQNPMNGNGNRNRNRNKNSDMNSTMNQFERMKLKAKGGNLIEQLLKPIKLEKNNVEVEKSYNKASVERNEKRPEYVRYDITNNPYKNILKNVDYKKHIADPKDLVVHKTTEKDRDKAMIEKELKEKEEQLRDHDGIIKQEYSSDRKEFHEKNFIYKASYVERIKHDTNTHSDLIDFYKNHQKKQEEGINKIDNILISLKDQGLLKTEDIPNELVDENDDDNENDANEETN